MPRSMISLPLSPRELVDLWKWAWATTWEAAAGGHARSGCFEKREGKLAA